MPITYAAKFSPLVDEAFNLQSLTEGIINHDYDWTGVNAVTVYSIPTVALSNYSLTGSARYGTAAELQNTYQTMTLSQDKAFTFTIDRRSKVDTMGTMDAARALAREVSQVVIPTVDAYRIAALVTAAVTAGNTDATPAASTVSTAYANFLAGQECIDNNKAPQGGRVALVTPAFLNLLKQSPSFVKYGDMATTIALNGQVGEIDGVAIVKVPTSYFPANTEFVITNAMVMPSPVKLAEYRVHENPVGISGSVVEGRIYYDAFVLNNKVGAVYAYKSA